MNKETVAWSIIAENVALGNKERALGVYRLLSSSFNDAALKAHLHADIYMVFSDYDAASVLYRQAFFLYQQSNRLREAAAMGESLIKVAPHMKDIQDIVIKIYHDLGFHNR